MRLPCISVIVPLLFFTAMPEGNGMYDPHLGRFCSKDPISYEVSKWNLFEYVNASATVRLDPFGLGDWCPFPHGPWPCDTDESRPDDYPVGNPDAGPILWPEPVTIWPPDDEFEDGSERCSCLSLKGNRMRPTSPTTGRRPPIAGLAIAECTIGEVVSVRYVSTCTPDDELQCKMPCEVSICWEYVNYKCEARRIRRIDDFPEITTRWVNGPLGSKRSKCTL